MVRSFGLPILCDGDKKDCIGTTDEQLGGVKGVDIWKTFVIGFWAFFNSVFFLKFLVREKGMRIRFKSGSTQKLYDTSWSLLIILHILVWGAEAVMWPFTYFNWFSFNRIYILLWEYLG